jgi:hypothetical protein
MDERDGARDTWWARVDPAGELMVSVRITRILAGREVTICLDRPFTEPWVMDVDDARKLHRDLGEALDSLHPGAQEEPL